MKKHEQMTVLSKMILHTTSFAILFFVSLFSYAQETQTFVWPDGQKMALSLTWDDGRESQVISGTPLLDKYGIKATFYVVPSALESALEKWKEAASKGHEIANHSLLHPCSGNFLWSREKALEKYSLNQMRDELNEANREIESLLGVKASTFAYPCGQTFVGRGFETKSYVPLISELFSSGRTWLDEAANDPAYVDLAQLTGIEMDGKNFDQIKTHIEDALGMGSWLVLAGHDIGAKNTQTTELEMLEKLLPYLNANENLIWVAPVDEISDYVRSQRGF